MNVTILTGGPESADFVAGVAENMAAGDQLTVIVNSSGDLWAHGLKACPDLDSVLFVLAPPPPGEPTFAASDAIAALGIEPSWLRSDDRSIAMQIVRTELLQAGFTLTQTAQALGTRLGLSTRLHIDTTVIPVSDDRVEQHVIVDGPAGSRAIHVREFDSHDHDQSADHEFVLVKADDWAAAPEALAVLAQSDVVVITSDDAIRSSLPMLATPGLLEAVANCNGWLCEVETPSRSKATIRAGHEALAALSTRRGAVMQYRDITTLIAANRKLVA